VIALREVGIAPARTNGPTMPLPRTFARRLREASKTALGPHRRLSTAYSGSRRLVGGLGRNAGSTAKRGKIRLVALSNHTGAHRASTQIVPIVSVQNRYSFADANGTTWSIIVSAMNCFIPWFPLGAGRVAGEVLNRIAQAHHASPHK